MSAQGKEALIRLNGATQVVVVLAIHGVSIEGFPYPTAQKEPFYLEARKFARKLSNATGFEVIVGFTGHGQPTLEDALEQAFATGAEKIILVDPEMCYRGQLTEEDEYEACQ